MRLGLSQCLKNQDNRHMDTGLAEIWNKRGLGENRIVAGTCWAVRASWAKKDLSLPHMTL